MAETPYTAYPYLKGPFMAVIDAFAQDAVDRAEPLTVAAAYAQCRDGALTWTFAWSYGDSNPRPLACHASALPTEL